MRYGNPSGMSPRDDAARERGFSLLELVIAATVLFTLIGITAAVLAGGQRLLGSASLQSEGEVKAAQIAQQIADRLMNGAIDTLLDGSDAAIADGGNSTTGVSVALVEKFVGEARLKGTAGFRLGTDGETNVTDGKDNDNDNLTDERSVTIVEWPAEPATDTKLSAWAGAPSGTATNRGTIGARVESVTVTRSGSRLEIAVVVMRFDPNAPASSVTALSEKVRRFTGRAYVTLKN